MDKRRINLSETLVPLPVIALLIYQQAIVDGQLHRIAVAVMAAFALTVCIRGALRLAQGSTHADSIITYQYLISGVIVIPVLITLISVLDSGSVVLIVLLTAFLGLTLMLPIQTWRTSRRLKHRDATRKQSDVTSDQ